MKNKLLLVLLVTFIFGFGYVSMTAARGLPYCQNNPNPPDPNNNNLPKCSPRDDIPPPNCEGNIEFCPPDCSYIEPPQRGNIGLRYGCHYEKKVDPNKGTVTCSAKCTYCGKIGGSFPEQPAPCPSPLFAGGPSPQPSIAIAAAAPLPNPTPVATTTTATPIMSNDIYLGCTVTKTNTYADDTTSTYTVIKSPSEMMAADCSRVTPSAAAIPSPSPSANCNSTHKIIKTTLTGEYVACEVTTTCTLADGTTTTRTVTESPLTITESTCLGQ